MATHSRKNLYPGVNAHLQSYLQNGGNWEGFHQGLIVSLQSLLTKALPDNYYADVQQSLQIKTLTKPDVLISRRHHPEIVRTYKPLSSIATEATLYPYETMEVEELIEYYPSLLIYQLRPENDDLPVTRIEVLSPSNKPPSGSHHEKYEQKRRETLAAKINLLEIDFLHETPPLESLREYVKNYAEKLPHSQAYHMVLTQPFDVEKNTLIYRVLSYEFGVDAPIPAIEIPLLGEESAWIEVGQAYHMTFELSAKYSYAVDYDQLPIAFNKYSPDDQQRIQARMQTVIQQERNES